MNEITISILVPVFNQEKYLPTLLDSILCQKINVRYEIVIGDDGSSDDSLIIIKKYKKRHPTVINFVSSKVNMGGKYNLAKILKIAKGKYYVYTDGDDEWIANNKLSLQYAYLENNKNIFATCHLVDIRNEFNFKIGTTPNIKFKDKFIHFEDVIHGKKFSVGSLMFKFINDEMKKNYINILLNGPLNHGDLTLALFLLKQSPIYIIFEPLSIYYKRNIKGDSNYNSIFTESFKLGERLKLTEYNDKHYQYKYFFGYLYFNIFLKLLTFIFIDKENFIQNIRLSINILISMMKNSLCFIWNKIKYRAY